MSRMEKLKERKKKKEEGGNKPCETGRKGRKAPSIDSQGQSKQQSKAQDCHLSAKQERPEY